MSCSIITSKTWPKTIFIIMLIRNVWLWYIFVHLNHVCSVITELSWFCRSTITASSHRSAFNLRFRNMMCITSANFCWWILNTRPSTCENEVMPEIVTRVCLGNNWTVGLCFLVSGWSIEYIYTTDRIHWCIYIWVFVFILIYFLLTAPVHSSILLGVLNVCANPFGGNCISSEIKSIISGRNILFFFLLNCKARRFIMATSNDQGLSNIAALNVLLSCWGLQSYGANLSRKFSVWGSRQSIHNELIEFTMGSECFLSTLPRHFWTALLWKAIAIPNVSQMECFSTCSKYVRL